MTRTRFFTQHQTPAKRVPVTFAMRPQDLSARAIYSRTALDAVLRHQANAANLDTLAAVVAYSLAMCQRLREDGSVDLSQVDAVLDIVRDGADAVGSVKERFVATGKIGCAALERQQLVSLVEAGEAIDRVATRRQVRDVTSALYARLMRAQPRAVDAP